LARYRLSELARTDIAGLLRTSEAQHGVEARIRYRGLLTAAMRRIAADPSGLSTLSREELFVGLRSFHTRHARNESREEPVAAPVHVLFFRALEPGLVEIVRVLHVRMEPSRHMGGSRPEGKMS
jgi:toxin ParE1/3/4